MIDVAVVGATGAVGETILRVLEERALPIGSLGPFASRARSAAVRFRDRTLDVHATNSEALAGYDVVFFASGEESCERYADALLERGAIVIDNSAAFRLHDGVPLVIPAVNPEVLRPEHRLFPVANCTAIVLCSALAPLARVAGLRAVRVATYQAASGAGRAAVHELIAGERALVLGEAEPEPRAFAAPLARNVVPLIGTLDASGYSGEERKVRDETRKMLGLPELLVSATTVRVPVHTAHAEAVFLETDVAVHADALAAALEAQAGIVYHRDGIVTPRDVEGTDLVHVARLRPETPEPSRFFALWCTGDQLRKGAATTAVAILELLLQRGMVRA